MSNQSSHAITENDLKAVLGSLPHIFVPQATGGKVGEIILFSGDEEPENWFFCDGRAVSRATYSELFAVIGTTYGAGNGSTTFNIPDLRGRFPIGADTTYAIGSTGGEASHTLTIDEIPSHNHGLPYWVGNGTAGTGGNGIWMQIATTKQTEDAGGGEAHNNMPPYLGVNYIICYRADNSTTSVDYIVDQGTSGDWTYRKWNSGFAECWWEKSITVGGNSVDASNYIAFPFTFTAIPTITCGLKAGGIDSYRFHIESSSTSTTQARLVLINTYSGSVPMIPQMYVFGKWK